MSISARTLFHFTRSADSLIGILSDEFHPSFCLEDRGNIDDWIGQDAIPMVCFCDLPLSDIREHLRFYGKYGLGLTKDWGIKKGLGPVIYVSHDSSVEKYLWRLFLTVMAYADESARPEFWELCSFVKPLNGKMFRDGSFVDKHFYDEREWRYVPRLSDIAEDQRGIAPRLSRAQYLDSIKRSHANREIAKCQRLAFEPDDIKYIVIADDSEINSTIDAIRQIKRKYDSRTVDLLSSRIITASQISEDF